MTREANLVRRKETVPLPAMDSAEVEIAGDRFAVHALQLFNFASLAADVALVLDLGFDLGDDGGRQLQVGERGFLGQHRGETHFRTA